LKYLVISIDTEADWFKPEKATVCNISSIPVFQDLCNQYGFKPTYLITYEVASKEESLKILKPIADSDQCEIGQHMHIWTSPPFQIENEYGTDQKWIHGFQSEIDDELFEQKMNNLHQQIIQNFGKVPTSHRAGRWAIDNRTFEWLEKNNYKVDSSICAHKTWKYSKGVNEFIKTNTFKVSNEAYYPSQKDITKNKLSSEKGYSVLEVPLTGIKLPYLNSIDHKSLYYFNTFSQKLGIFKFGSISFRPSYNMKDYSFSNIVNRLFESDCQIFNFMFHSNELASGTSPYSKNETATKHLLQRIESVFMLAKEHGIKGIKLSDVHDLYNHV
jgi:hypothetical protein